MNLCSWLFLGRLVDLRWLSDRIFLLKNAFHTDSDLFDDLKVGTPFLGIVYDHFLQDFNINFPTHVHWKFGRLTERLRNSKKRTYILTIWLKNFIAKPLFWSVHILVIPSLGKDFLQQKVPIHLIRFTDISKVLDNLCPNLINLVAFWHFSFV